MVIIASLTIFALCSLLMLYTLKSISLGEYNSQVLNERLAIDQIGDDYLNYLNGELANFDTNGYTYKIKDREITYTIITRKGSDTSSLVVYDYGLIELSVDFVLDKDLNKYKITKWSYGE